MNTTARLYRTISPKKNFKFIAKGIYSITRFGTDHGSVTIRLLDSGSVVRQTQTFSLTSSPQDFTLTYNDENIAITRIDLSCSETSTEEVTFYAGSTEIIDLGNVFWRGWIKPDNLSRPFIQKSYTMNLNAVDGLADLKTALYPITGLTGLTNLMSYTPLINIVQTCLNQNGIPLPIKVQANIFENNLMTGTTKILFSQVNANQQRFILNDSGRITTISCYDALDYLLSSFACKISQVNGCWAVTQDNEQNTKQNTYSYSALTATTISYNRSVDITNNKIKIGSDELSKMPSMNRYELTFHNYNLGGTVLPNSYFDTDTTGWHNGTGLTSWQTFTYDSTNKRLHTGESGVMNCAVKRGIYTDPFYVSDSGSGSDYLNLTLKLDTTVSFNAGVTYPTLKTTLIYPNTTGRTSTGLTITNGVHSYSGATNVFRIAGSGMYQLTIEEIPDIFTDYNSIIIYWDNVELHTKYNGESVGTRDHYYQGAIANNGVNVGTTTSYFGDGLMNNDVGNLKVSNKLTSKWSNYGNSEQLSLQDLLVYNKMKLSDFFKDYIVISIKDYGKVFFNNMLQIGSKKYTITNYSYDLMNNDLDLEIVEQLENTPTITYTDSTLSTVDGK